MGSDPAGTPPSCHPALALLHCSSSLFSACRASQRRCRYQLLVIAHRRRQRARQPTLAAASGPSTSLTLPASRTDDASARASPRWQRPTEHPSHPAPTPAPPDHALNPAPYRNLGARRAQPTQAPHSTGSDRPQPQHEAPRPPNGPNPLKKDHFFCARGMNQRVGRGRQFVQYIPALYCTFIFRGEHQPPTAAAGARRTTASWARI